ncbi:Os01g0100300, partial [Oryza sativa Japonica Group]
VCQLAHYIVTAQPHAHVRERPRHGRGRRVGSPPLHRRPCLLRHQPQRHDRRDGGDDVEDARRVERHSGVGTQLHRHREGRCPERRRDHRQGQLQHRRRRRHGLPQSCRRCCSAPRVRLVSVPLASLLHIRADRATYEAWKLGRKIDALLLDIIESRRRCEGGGRKTTTTDLLWLLLAGNEASAAAERKLTTALALSWTLLMLATHPEWRAAVREEVEEVTGWSGPMDAAAMGKLTKMGCMLNEVLRLYPPSPNVQRPAACDAEVVRGKR